MLASTPLAKAQARHCYYDQCRDLLYQLYIRLFRVRQISLPLFDSTFKEIVNYGYILVTAGQVLLQIGNGS